MFRPFSARAIFTAATALIVLSPAASQAQDSSSNVDASTTRVAAIPMNQRPRLAIKDFEFQAQLSPEDRADLNSFAAAIYVMRGGNPQAVAETNTSNLAKSTSQLLTERLQNTKQFRVFEREQLAAVTGEQDLVASDRAKKGQTVAATGALLGAQYVVTGAITKFGKSKKKKGGMVGAIVGRVGGGLGVSQSKTDYEVGLTVKVIDASTGEVLASETSEGEVTGDTERRLTGLAGTWGAIGGGMFNSSATGEREMRITEALQRAIDQIVLKLVEARESGNLTA